MAGHRRHPPLHRGNRGGDPEVADEAATTRSMMNTIILASASAARLALLRQAGVPVTPRPARIDEARIKQAMRGEGHSATGCAMRLAEEKALAISRGEPDSLVLGADQLLVLDGKWFDKPPD